MKLMTWNINGLRATVFGGNFADTSHDARTTPENQPNDKNLTKKFLTLPAILGHLNADIFCFQEVKTPRDQLEETLALVPGFISFFSFCQRKKNAAYSGVATYCRESFAPFKVEEGLSGYTSSNVREDDDRVGHYGDLSGFAKDQLKELDSEGRALITQHRISDGSVISIINVYCPYGGEEGERTEFKINFYQLLKVRASALAASGSYVIILGDINTSHHLIDHCEGDSRDSKEFYDNPGRTFLSELLLSSSPSKNSFSRCHDEEEERVEMDRYEEGKRKHEKGTGGNVENGNSVGGIDDDIDDSIGSNSSIDLFESSPTSPKSKSTKTTLFFIDAFRCFHPTRKDAFTCWNTSIGARATNYGTRIDYIFPDASLAKRFLIDCDIMPHIEGSDHCPVIAEFSLKLIADAKIPTLATKFWPEYAGGKQRTINAFFGKKTDSDDFLSSQESSRKRPVDESSQGGGCVKKAKIGPSKPKTLLDFVSRKSKINEKRPPATIIVDNGTQFSQKESDSIDSTDGDESASSRCGNAGKAESSDAWKKLLKGPDKVPLCKGHREPCVGNKVKKPGPNFGRKFFACARPTGHATNKQARCNHFEWASK